MTVPSSLVVMVPERRERENQNKKRDAVRKCSECSAFEAKTRRAGQLWPSQGRVQATIEGVREGVRRGGTPEGTRGDLWFWIRAKHHWLLPTLPRGQSPPKGAPTAIRGYDRAPERWSQPSSGSPAPFPNPALPKKEEREIRERKERGHRCGLGLPPPQLAPTRWPPLSVPIPPSVQVVAFASFCWKMRGTMLPVFLCQTKHSPSPSLSKSKKASLNSAICSSLSCVAVADSVILLCYGVNACAVKWLVDSACGRPPVQFRFYKKPSRDLG